MGSSLPKDQRTNTKEKEREKRKEKKKKKKKNKGRLRQTWLEHKKIKKNNLYNA